MADYKLTATDIVIRAIDAAVIPNDPDNRDRAAYTAWLALGNVPDPYVMPTPHVPYSISPGQARMALLNAGLLDQVEAAVAAADKATQIAWQYATEIRRTDPLITTLGTALGLTAAQIDALFVAAAAIVI
jgi:hypothetical protein